MGFLLLLHRNHMCLIEPPAFGRRARADHLRIGPHREDKIYEFGVEEALGLVNKVVQLLLLHLSLAALRGHDVLNFLLHL